MKHAEDQAQPRTRKPCPGCKKSPPWGSHLTRPKDEVCCTCKAWIEWAKEQREKAANPMDGIVVVGTPPEESTHRWPQFYCGLAGHHGPDRERLEKLLVRLACLLSEEVGEQHWENGMSVPDGIPQRLINELHPSDPKKRKKFFDRFGSNPWQGTDVRRLMRADVAQVIRDLYDAIADVLIVTCREAMVEGQDLLRNLAMGRVAPEEFNAIQERTRDETR